MHRTSKYVLTFLALLAAVAVADGAKKKTGRKAANPGPSAEVLMEQGREAYLAYDFEKASRLFSQANAKAKNLPEEEAEKLSDYRRQLLAAENFMERVEKIAVIDSLTVPREEFFAHYRIPVSSGTLRGGGDLPSSLGEADYVFTNEGGDYKLWAAPDTTGYYRLMESSLLTDGEWSQASPLPDNLAEGGDEIYPFMMSDGVTLYYADNGENSIGGYDIMVATRDPSDGSFLQPSNLGFPYNSPYDDYLLAIDELNGVGWWATDRNQLDDALTVYVFVTNDLRQNYSEDDADDLTPFARIDDFRATQPEDADYTELLETIARIDPNQKVKHVDFRLPLGDGKILTSYDELPGQTAKAAMKRYLAAKASLESEETALERLRKRYYVSRSSQTASQIRSMETDVEGQRENLRKLRSAVYDSL